MKKELTDLFDMMIDQVPTIYRKRHDYHFKVGSKVDVKGKHYRGFKIKVDGNLPATKVLFL